MSPLRRAFQSLRTPNTKPWHLVVTPNPNFFLPRQSAGNEGEYLLKVDGIFNKDLYLKKHTSIAYAASENAIVNKDFALREPGVRTQWIRVIDSKQKTADGQTLRELMRELLSEFPKYDLQSSQGTEHAINAIERRLGEIATFEEELPVPSRY